MRNYGRSSDDRTYAAAAIPCYFVSIINYNPVQQYHMVAMMSYLAYQKVRTWLVPRYIKYTNLTTGRCDVVHDMMILLIVCMYDDTTKQSYKVPLRDAVSLMRLI